jgi:hypothetical protein
MSSGLIFALLAISSFIIWLLAFKLEKIFAPKESGEFTNERVESAEYSKGNSLTIGFEYFPFAIISLASEAVILSMLIFGSSPYILVVPLLGSILLWKTK